MTAIGSNIVRIARDKGLIHNHIAKVVGVSNSQLSAMIHGRKVIRAEHVSPLAKALMVTPNELLDIEC